jgi:preprotein translocase subunit SecE
MGHVTGATVTYALGLTLAVVAAIASTVMCVAGVLVTDAAECKENGKLTIIQKVLKFLREYKSELKKVVWPGPRSVVKNTLVVLGVCGVALLIIWLVDMGLFKLFELCFGA